MEGRDNDDVDMDLLVDDAPNDNKDFERFFSKRLLHF